MNEILAYLFATGGAVWVAAQVAEFAALLAESAVGKSHKRAALAGVFMVAAAILTPALLYIHGYVAWARQASAHDPLHSFFGTIGSLSVLTVVFGGGLVGWVFGLAVKPARPFLHRVALPLAALALALAFLAAIPSLPDFLAAVAGRLPGR